MIAPTILVVSNPDMRVEIYRMLSSAGFRRMLTGDGSDETLELFEDVQPDLVVLCANLEHGDARALSSAMRSSAHGVGVKQILIGERDGPIRTALDAVDFEIDHFLVQPLSEKALVYAVGMCLEQSRKAAAEAAAEAAASAAASHHRLEIAVDEAIDAHVQTAIEELEPVLAEEGATDATDGAADAVSADSAATDGATEEQAPATAGEAAAGEAAAVGEAADGEAASMGDDAAGDDTADAADDQPEADAGAPPTAAPAVKPLRSTLVGRPAPEPPDRVPTAVPQVASDRISGSVSAPVRILPRADRERLALPVETSPPRKPPGGLPRKPAGGRPRKPAAPSPGMREPTSAPPEVVPIPATAANVLARVRLVRVPRDAVADDSGPIADARGASAPPAARATIGSAPEPAAAAGGTSAGSTPAAPAAAAGSTSEPFASTPEDTAAAFETTTVVPAEPVRDPAFESTTEVDAEPAPPVAPASDPDRDTAPTTAPRSAGDDGAVRAELAAGQTAGDTERSTGAIERSPVAGEHTAGDAASAAGAIEHTAGDADQSERADRDGPPSSDLARELRRKMSAMAQRLFPDKRTDVTASLDLDLEHDAATEIDLASLDMLDDDDSDRDPAPSDEPLSVDEDYDEPMGQPADAPMDGGLTQDAPPPLPGVAGRGHIRRGDIEAASLMARMFDTGFTGRIEFQRGDQHKSIQFEKGRPVFASSDDPRDRMGELLYREGKVTRDHYEQCQAEAAATGRRIGEILVDRGFLKRRELLPAVRRHVEDIVYSLFAWSEGEFSITPTQHATGEQIRLSRHPAAMILEGVRRKYGADDLADLVGPPGSVIEIQDDQRRKLVMSVADLSPAERRLVSSFDGERDLEELAIDAQIELESTYQLAYGLIVIGVARSRRLDTHIVEDPPGSVLVGETDLAIDRQRVLAKYALIDDADYFALLGVRRDATTFEIKRAYQSARRDYARDSFPAEVRRELAAELDTIVEVLDEAYQILRREDIRASYLANLRD